MMVNEKIKKYLEENGIKQNYVARKISCNSKTFNNILNGRIKCDAELLKKICLVLNEDPKIFLS